MNTITIHIPDDRLVKLQETASRLGVSIEELVLMGVEQLLKQPEASFQNAMGYVLKKNAELYKRLA
ncbi:DNA-binding protein [Scytonema sp. PCC 10023]|uniref:DNA-binding protein n=1 Tax=Scytonema sp. PCC 10023 TaxID=1680591 RepID=UPI0039C5D966